MNCQRTYPYGTILWHNRANILREFIENLPKTRSGKIMRRLLKARELGLPEGDTSILEE